MPHDTISIGLKNIQKEALSMWSEALPMLDENSLKYRVEELSEELDNANKKLKQSQKETQAALARIKELEQLLASKK